MWPDSESLHPSVLAGVAVLAALYAIAARFSHKPLRRSQAVAFAAALVTVVFALCGPVDELEDARLFSAHMLQHLMLALVMPPLLLLGLPDWMIRPLLETPLLKRAARLLTRPLIAFALYNAVLIWIHTPSVFDYMCRDETFHITVHLILMGVSVPLWWPILSPLLEMRLSYPAQILYLFIWLIPMAAVAAPITLAADVIYPWYLEGPHPFAISPLADQVLGGLLMWVGAGFYLIGVFTVIFFRWAQHDDRDEPSAAAPFSRVRKNDYGYETSFRTLG